MRRRNIETALQLSDACAVCLADPTPEKLDTVCELCAALVAAEPTRRTA